MNGFRAWLLAGCALGIATLSAACDLDTTVESPVDVAEEADPAKFIRVPEPVPQRYIVGASERDFGGAEVEGPARGRVVSCTERIT